MQRVGLFREITEICCENYAKHIGVLSGQTVDFLPAKQAVHVVIPPFNLLKPSGNFTYHQV
jgi:hypothetical protein